MSSAYTKQPIYKVAEFDTFLCTHNPDIVCVVETWLHNNIPDSLFCPDNYRVVRCDRSGRGGGVALFIRNSLNYSEVKLPTEFGNLEIVCVDVEFDNLSARLIGYYCNGGFGVSAIDYMLNTVKCIKFLCSTDKTVFLLGDFNLPDIDWEYYYGPDNVVYNSLLDFINSYGFTQFVRHPTRDNHILDLVLCTSDSIIKNLDMLPPIGLSDHNVVLFSPNVSPTVAPVMESVYESYNWKNADYEAITCYVNSVNWNQIFQVCFNVEECWNAFTGVLYEAVNLFVPKSKFKPNQSKSRNIRYPRYIRNLIQYKAVMWKRWKISSHAEDKSAYKLAASKCTAAIKKYHAAKETELVRKCNLGSFYNFVNQRLNKHNILADIRKSDGTLTQDDNEKAGIFNDFSQVSSVLTTVLFQSLPIESMLPIHICLLCTFHQCQ